MADSGKPALLRAIALIGDSRNFRPAVVGIREANFASGAHRLIPFGIFGYFINVVTGISFFVGEPDQYLYNPSFQIKMVFMTLAGINVMLFYLTMFRYVKTRGSGENAPLPARIMGGASLVFWIGVLSCGRLLTFFRPPTRWCPWC